MTPTPLVTPVVVDLSLMDEVVISTPYNDMMYTTSILQCTSMDGTTAYSPNTENSRLDSLIPVSQGSEASSSSPSSGVSKVTVGRGEPTITC